MHKREFQTHAGLEVSGDGVLFRRGGFKPLPHAQVRLVVVLVISPCSILPRSIIAGAC